MVALLVVVLVATAPGLAAATAPSVVRAYFGHEVVEDSRGELAALLPLLQAQATGQGLTTQDEAPETPGARWWLVYAVIGWRGTDDHRRLVLTLEVEEIADGGAWWSDRVPLTGGYSRTAVVGAFTTLLGRAREAVPGF